MKIIVVTGTRPEIIKISVLLRILIENENISLVFIHSGQHYDKNLFDKFLDELNLPIPDYNLNIGSGSHSVQLAKILYKLDHIIRKENPDIVLVQGDTNTVLGVALVCGKLNIGVGHIEAGLRSFDKTMPEELNRIITGTCSVLHFSPNERAAINLLFENINRKNIFIVGNTILDACLYNLELAENYSRILEKLNFNLTMFNILITIHRPSNVDNKKVLEKFVNFLIENKSYLFIFPIHPRTRKKFIEYSLYDKICDLKHVKIIDPLGYLDLLKLLKNCNCCITDSGGIQEEAAIMKIPCITVRNNTERPETIEIGGNILVGHNFELLNNTIKNIQNNNNFLRAKISKDVFGDGNASKKILKILLDRYNKHKLKFHSGEIWINIPNRTLSDKINKNIRLKKYELKFGKYVQLVFDKNGNPKFPKDSTIIKKGFSVLESDKIK